MAEIKIPKVEIVPIDSLKVDGKNPNKMNPERRKSLRKNLEKYGFIVPIVTNKDLLIADGQTRWEEAKELGMKNVPIIRLPISDVDRRILRQVLNKLRGEHDSYLDAEEFKFLLDQNAMHEFEELIGESDKKLVQFMARIDREGKGSSEEGAVINEVVSPTCNLIRGDSLEEINNLKNNSIDLCLTDPPYGLEFMGKEWDKWEDSFTQDWASAVFPKLKDGAFLVFTMTPRQDLLWRCLAGLEKAGYKIDSSSMYWLYHTGFPKALDASKAIDKEKGTERELIGRGKGAGTKGNTFPLDSEYNKTTPINPTSKKWNGWKSFQLKPAVECIVIAQKPFKEKTIVGQVIETGTGAVNIEATRIPYASENDIGERHLGKPRIDTPIYGKANPELNPPSEQGRFPANLLVSGKPLVGDVSKSPSGFVKRQPRASSVFTSKNCGFKSENLTDSGYGDKGTPNRFYSLDAWAKKRNITLTQDSALFDVPKPSKREKNEGCEGLEEKLMARSGGAQQAEKHGKKEYLQKHIGLNRITKVKNNHPTTKPIALFTYLAEMFCQPNGTILDPFMGSGTTGIACGKALKKFIGIEKEAEYFNIAKTRIKHHLKKIKQEAK